MVSFMATTDNGNPATSPIVAALSESSPEMASLCFSGVGEFVNASFLGGLPSAPRLEEHRYDFRHVRTIDASGMRASNPRNPLQKSAIEGGIKSG